MDLLWRLSPGEEAQDRVGREVLAPRFHGGEALAFGMVAEPAQASGTDGGGDADAGGLRQNRVGTRVVRVYGDRLSAVSEALVWTNTAKISADRAERQQ